MSEQLRKQIAAARRRGFKPGDSYWRDADLMVEILPGRFVNEATAKSLGIKPRRDDVEYARARA